MQKNFNGGKGLAVVLEEEGQTELECYGGVYYHVHPCQLIKVEYRSNMYQTEKRLEYKIVDKEPPMNNFSVDHENNTHKYFMPNETDSQKEDLSDSRCENSPQNVIA